MEGLGFSPATVAAVKDMLAKVYSGAFSYLATRAELESSVAQNDTLILTQTYSIGRTVEPCKSIIPGVQRIKYTAYAEVCIAKGSWDQPAEYDTMELGSSYMLDDALLLIITRELKNAMAAYREEQAYRRDHEEPEHPGGTSA